MIQLSKDAFNRIYRSFTLTILFLLLSAITNTSIALETEEVPFSNAINIVRNHEKNVGLISCEGDGFDIVWNPQKKQYRLMATATSEWVNGEAPTMTCSIALSFDGKTYREYSRCATDPKKLSDATLGRGIITNDLSDSPFNQSLHLYQYGITIGAPSIFYDYYGELYENSLDSPDFLSSYLKQWSKTGALDSIKRINDQKNDILEISASFTTSHGVRVRLVLDYNLGLGGVVTSVKYYCQDPENNSLGEVLENEYKVVFKDTEHNSPIGVKKTHWKNGDTEIINYSFINSSSETKTIDFNIDYPTGTRVTDMNQSLEYKVGDVVDEDRMINDFMQLHGYTNNTQHRIKQSQYTRYTLIGLGSIMILFALYRMNQKRRKL